MIRCAAITNNIKFENEIREFNRSAVEFLENRENPIKLVWCDDKRGREKADIPGGSSQSADNVRD